MPAASAYEVAYSLDGPQPKVLVAQTSGGLLDAWYTQTALPVANTALGVWLMDQAGYTPPPPTTGTPGPTSGRGYPS